jgi:UDP-N-acetylmuramoylalanine--D-glutamate ligase
LLIGAAAEKIASQIAGSVKIDRVATVEGAVEHASRHAKPGDVVLLSPACASFDQFENYEHRGRVFKELVLQLEKKSSSASAQGK